MKSWALVVGIDTYPDAVGQAQLKGAVADACDFADWVLDPAGGAVPADSLFFWTHPWPASPGGRLADYLAGQPPRWSPIGIGPAGPAPDKPPCAFEITSTIEGLGRVLAAKALEEGDDETRRIYVFLAGHGVRAMNMDRQEETCFVAGDARPLPGNLAAGMVPCDSFRRALLDQRFHEAIIFTDCCRTSVPKTSIRVQVVSDPAGNPLRPYAIGFAARDNDLAHETATTPARGAFSSVLMQGLRNHRVGHELKAKHLHLYVQDRIVDFTQSGQVPSVLYAPQPDGPLIAVGRSPGARQGPEADVSALPEGTVLVLHDGRDEPVAGVDPFVVDGPAIRLPPLNKGLYVLVRQDGSGGYTQFRYPNSERIHVV